jgi:hypothetical protein
MTQSSRDKDAASAVEAAILGLFQPETIDQINVRPVEDHTGEAALSVTVFLKAAQKRMSGAQLLDAIAASATALREIDDNRFPYVTFLAPEDESAEDTRPAA